MQVPLRHVRAKVTDSLMEAAASLPPGRVSLRDLLALAGEQSMLLLCVLCCIPFLLPISIPGSSMPFGCVITLVGSGIALDRIPWLPKWLLGLNWSTQRVRSLLEGGARHFQRLEKLVRPRVLLLTEPGLFSRFNGIALAMLGILLMIPWPPIFPLSNTIPAWGIVILSLGLLQRDGWFVVAGYLLLLGGFIYGAVMVAATIQVTRLLGGMLTAMFT